MLLELYSKGILFWDFLLFNGDNITECNLNDLVDRHYINENDVTVSFSNDPQSITCLLMDKK